MGRYINADDVELIGTSGTLLGYNLFAYCQNNPIMYSDPTGYFITPANVIGAVISGILGAVGGYFLLRWLADKIGLDGWKRSVFIGGLTAVITASAATIGYFIGPYVARSSKTIINSLKTLIKTNCCFVAGTLISTPEGELPIESIKIGDSVYSKNLVTGKLGVKKVTDVFVRQTDTLCRISTDTDEIITTEEHPFWVENVGWVEASQLSTGVLLCLQNGETTTVTNISIEHLENPITVYNFEVEDFHTYFVGSGNILVHNQCNWNVISDNFLKRKGLDAHGIKYEYLGKKANIKLYDLYYDKSTGPIAIFEKATKKIVEVTTYFIK